VDILAHISSLPEAQQPAAYGKIEAIERRAMAVQKPTAGLTELMEYLSQKGVRKGICTRNFEYVLKYTGPGARPALLYSKIQHLMEI
jgi:hypothetical protein